MKHKYLILILITSFLGLLNSCSKDEDISTNPEFAQYISAYTSGVISKKSPIKIVLTPEVAAKIDKAKLLDGSVLEFSPSLKGEITWVDGNTIVFKPKEDLPSGEIYKAKLKLGKLVDVKKELKKFAFKFQVIKQNFEIQIDKIQTTDKENYKLQSVYGSLICADELTIDDLKKMMSAEKDSKTLKIDFQNNGDKHFSFRIDSVDRRSVATNLFIKWDGSTIGIKKSDKMTVEIPALSDFKMLWSRVLQAPEQCLMLQFSDPINEEQNVDGLVALKNAGEVRYTVDGNCIYVYPTTRLNGSFVADVNAGLTNSKGTRLGKSQSIPVLFEEIKPAVKMVSKGVILPTTEKGLVLPFEAVNLRAVDVQVTKIYQNNIPQFLQVNDINGQNELYRVGTVVLRKAVRLDQSDVLNFSKWNRYTLDLNQLIKADQGAIYQITINFRKEYSLFSCDGKKGDAGKQFSLPDNLPVDDKYWRNVFPDNHYSDYEEDEGYDYDTYWENRDNPCSTAYFRTGRAVKQNILSSNIGLIAKAGNDKKLIIFANDIRTTQPMKGVKIDVMSYQNQVLKSAVTDGDGKAEFEEMKDGFLVIASIDKEKGYLKIADGNSLSLSRFDVAGTEVKKGLKGFIYGERGVWRPGDSIYLSFILQEQAKPLPEGHPIVLEFRNPKMQLIKKIVRSKTNTNLYVFNLSTEPTDPTGNWEAKVTVGGVSFFKSLKIETIKPNRLKVNLDFKTKMLAAGAIPNASLKVAWLHGAVAKSMNYSVDAMMTPQETKFSQFKNFIFDDSNKKFQSEMKNVAKGILDDNGNASVHVNLNVGANAPGILSASFYTKVFEKGGDFSTDVLTIPYYPYTAMVGIESLKPDDRTGMLVTGKEYLVNVVNVNPSGNLVNESHTLEVEISKLEWRWWWEQSTLTSYEREEYGNKIKKYTINTDKGNAHFKFSTKTEEWGRYMLRVKDLKTGHTTSEVIYVDYPYGYEQSSDHGSMGATMLTFSSDKPKYTIGEKVNLTIPSSAGGRALVSIENGTKVLETFWVETTKGQTKFAFDTKSEMAPNVFVHVTLLQPHSQTVNDLPIRLYGLIPISVEDPKTHLEPVISMPEVIKAEDKVTINVSEKNNRPMTYTLAVVEEGLLDLTRFKTPDPWETFFAREALGVKTWDLYDFVIGAFGGDLERLLSIGGDGGLANAKKQKANRFKPVVKFFGPFELKSGKNQHTFTMPQYIGSVRAMVVACGQSSYGASEKTAKVKKPLMVLGTLPRVLGPNETVKLPVTIFTSEDNMKNVSVKIKTNPYVKTIGSNQKTVDFAKAGEQTVDFDLQVQPQLGDAKVEIEATSGSEKANFTIDLEVRNPNPKVTDVYSGMLENGATWNQAFKVFGLAGSSKVSLEVSAIPPINLEKRMKYLIGYPHGCIEQTTSSVFPQLYLNDIADISAERKTEIEQNVKAAIDRLSSFQLTSGGFSYWPGLQDVDEWGTNYAGHFIVEASKKGYVIPDAMMRSWKAYQKQKAQSWSDDGPSSQQIQAYRLYTLAVANSAESGAMNRLRESKGLADLAKWYLASAFQLSGKTLVAQTLITGLSTNTTKYSFYDYTYGSALRDKSVILQCFNLMGKRNETFNILKEVAVELSSDRWLSTQTTAYALLAVSEYLGRNATTKQLTYSYTLDGKESSHKASKAFSLEYLKTGLGDKTISLKNTSGALNYVRLTVEGIPETGPTTDAESNLKIAVSYSTLAGVPVNPEKLQQGTDLVCEVRVNNPGLKGNYSNLALVEIFPSGWEIINPRMIGEGSEAPFTYQDIRDDRVYTYFNLGSGETKIFKMMLNASYAGKFYLPAVSCEAMYDASISARRKGKWVEVVRQ